MHHRFLKIGKFFLPVLFPTVFYFFALFTMYDYGINWDSAVHFSRGQAFFHYFVTGKKNYKGLPSFCMSRHRLISQLDYKTREICNRHRKVRVSQFQSPLLDYAFAQKDIYGHPAFGDIMLAVSNNIFYQRLGILEDTQAYYFYTITLTYIFAIVIAVWAMQTMGFFASVVSVLCFYLFPLLSGEQHFNIKDPPMAAYFTLAIYFFYESITKKKARFMYLSALFGGMSFGTKLNFIFAPVILFPWIVCYVIFKQKVQTFFSIIPKKILIAILVYPVIVFSIFYFSWPALWSDPVAHIGKVLGFYKDIGVNQCEYAKFTFPWLTKCSNLQPLQYFLYTIPLISLFLFFAGYITGLAKWKEKQYVFILWISFFTVTLLRVTLPIALSYGGLRQLLEFLGPFALLAGLGAVTIRNFLVHKINEISPVFAVWFASILILAGFIPIIRTLIYMHPNENVYFNAFIGGLKGAAEKKFEGYGNTYGNANFQGVIWVNKHTEPNAKVTLLTGHGQDVLRSSLRPDISFSGGTFLSGYNQSGEYVLSLPSQSMSYKNTFRYKYFYTFLNPVYDVQLDGVSLVKIWKNDPKYIKKNLDLKNEHIENIHVVKSEKEINITLPDKKKIKRLEITFTNKQCIKPFIPSQLFTSANSKNFVLDSDTLNDFTQDEVKGYNADIPYFFAGDTIKAIKIIVPENYSCEGDISYKVYVFSHL